MEGELEGLVQGVKVKDGQQGSPRTDHLHIRRGQLCRLSGLYDGHSDELHDILLHDAGACWYFHGWQHGGRIGNPWSRGNADKSKCFSGHYGRNLRARVSSMHSWRAIVGIRLRLTLRAFWPSHQCQYELVRFGYGTVYT